jgi:tetratricopeptide (TPR) repeat protein
MNFSDNKKLRGLICLALAFVTFGIYWQVHGFGFVNYDDPDYVTENSMVRGGLSFNGIIWSFTHFYASNWHPLTWISHMLDCQLFGVNPGGPHVVNVLLHAANAILLFLLLHRLTGAQWRSAIVAGLFAWHPLHVESVAWISERKDVLSTFFGLLSLLAYARYVDESKVQSPKSKTAYSLALIFFAFSLMSKSMLVTLPCVMLLLDVWPLQRVENTGWRAFFTPQFARLILEKAPWFGLSVAASSITFIAQKTGGAVMNVEHFPMAWRLFNAVESYVGYIQKTFWPTGLAVFYPMEYVRPIGPFVVHLVLLILMTVAALATLKRWPFLLVGWFWFLGTLVPVIGLVQVGSQSMADRYSYVPMIGLLIAIVWGTHTILSDSRPKILAGGIAAAMVLTVLITVAFVQIRYWKSSITLFSHALNVTTANTTALIDLGVGFFDLGRNEDAMKMYQVALQVDPTAADVHKNIGLVLAKTGKPDEALAQYREAVRLSPNSAALQNFLAVALSEDGKKDEALPHYNEAVRLEPANAQYQTDLAVTLVALGKRAEALPHYQQAAWLDPSNAHYQNNFATALARSGDENAAIQYYQAAIRDDPKFAEAYSNLGALLTSRHQLIDAAKQYSEAIRLGPTNATIRFNFALVLLKLNRADDALTQLTEAARLRPDWPEPLNAAAWALATSDNEKLRNGAEAVKFAEKAADLTSRRQPLILNTLAAAYAESGRFDDALSNANAALQLAQDAGHTNQAAKIEQAIILYQSKTPLREKHLAN